MNILSRWNFPLAPWVTVLRCRIKAPMCSHPRYTRNFKRLETKVFNQSLFGRAGGFTNRPLALTTW